MAPPERGAERGTGPSAVGNVEPRLTVVIVNWNRTQNTLECIESLAAWKRIEARVWVIDNGSEDGGLDEIEHRFPQVRLTRAGTNLGFGAANNLALRQIRSPYALLLNNDAHIDEASVEMLLAGLDSDPTIAVSGPVVETTTEPRKVLSAGGRDVLRHMRTHLRATDLEPGLLEGPRPFDVDYVPGSVALLRMPTVRALGFLDEEYFFGGELADLCQRVRAVGSRSVVVPAARASHDLEVAVDHRRQLYPYYILRNRFLFARKFAGARGALYAALWVGLGMAMAARAATQWRWPELRALLLGLRDGLARRGGSGNHYFERRPRAVPVGRDERR